VANDKNLWPSPGEVDIYNVPAASSPAATVWTSILNPPELTAEEIAKVQEEFEVLVRGCLLKSKIGEYTCWHQKRVEVYPAHRPDRTIFVRFFGYNVLGPDLIHSIQKMLTANLLWRVHVLDPPFGDPLIIYPECLRFCFTEHKGPKLDSLQEFLSFRASYFQPLESLWCWRFASFEKTLKQVDLEQAGDWVQVLGCFQGCRYTIDAHSLWVVTPLRRTRLALIDGGRQVAGAPYFSYSVSADGSVSEYGVQSNTVCSVYEWQLDTSSVHELKCLYAGNTEIFCERLIATSPRGSG
jgi:hypothetical protein